MTDLNEELADLALALIRTVDSMAPVERETFLNSLARLSHRPISTAALRQLQEKVEERFDERR